MKPSVAVDITARDKTQAAAASAERRFGAMAKKTETMAKGSGFGALGKQVEGLKKLGKLDLGFEKLGESLSKVGEFGRAANENVENLAHGVLSFGGSAPGVMGEVAEAAGVVAGAVAGAAAAVAGLAVGAYVLGEKWAKTGAEIERTAQSLGVSTDALQAARAAGERFGVTADQTTASMDGLASTLYDARFGGNNRALGALTQLGIELKTGKDGAIDYAQALYDISDAVKAQTDPGAQRKIAQVFGLSAMLPALRKGSAALKAEGKDYLGSGAALTPDEAEKAEGVEKSTVTLKQHLAALETQAGVAAMGLTGAAANAGLGIMTAGGKAADKAGDVMSQVPKDLWKMWESAKGAARELGHAGSEAGHKLVDGAEQAGKALGTEFTRFVDRIEHQESRGHQFEYRKGHAAGTLVSAAGAVGDMQLLPESARIEARRAGIPWDSGLFRTNKDYNRKIGQAYLARLLRKYDGDEVLAAAAYNAGEGRVDGTKKHGYRDGWLARFGDPRKGEISDEEFAARIPYAETKDYVGKTAQARVEIVLTGAPPGTVAKVASGPGVALDMKVARSLADKW